MSLDEAIAQIEKEFPGFQWNLRWDGKQACCTLTSPDFKSHIWEAGGKTQEDITAGVRVVWYWPDATIAVLKAIEIAKDERGLK